MTLWEDVTSAKNSSWLISLYCPWPLPRFSAFSTLWLLSCLRRLSLISLSSLSSSSPSYIYIYINSIYIYIIVITIQINTKNILVSLLWIMYFFLYFIILIFFSSKKIARYLSYLIFSTERGLVPRRLRGIFIFLSGLFRQQLTLVLFFVSCIYNGGVYI